MTETYFDRLVKDVLLDINNHPGCCSYTDLLDYAGSKNISEGGLGSVLSHLSLMEFVTVSEKTVYKITAKGTMHLRKCRALPDNQTKLDFLEGL